MKKTQATGSNFILMRNSGRPKHQSHRRELHLLMSIAFAVETAEEQAEKRKFVGMHGQLAGDRVAEVAKNGAGMLDTLANRAKELAPLKMAASNGNRL